MFSLLLDKHFGEDLLDHRVDTRLAFYEPGTFPKVAVALRIPSSRVGGPGGSSSWSTFGVVSPSYLLIPVGVKWYVFVF